MVHLLASLSESFNMLVTALEANTDVPRMDVVMERLLHEERKLKDREDSGPSHEKAMMSRFKRSLLSVTIVGKWDISSVIVVSYLLKKQKSRFNCQGKQRANKLQ